MSVESNVCVELLEEVLELAREGKISSVGIIACMRDGFATTMAGKQASELYLGCAALQEDILSAVREGAVSSGGVSKTAVTGGRHVGDGVAKKN